MNKHTDMNTDAIVAWMYVVECLVVFGKEVQKDYAFLRLMVDLRNAYPDEYEMVLGFFGSSRKETK
jgi:hypothetical protein